MAVGAQSDLTIGHDDKMTVRRLHRMDGHRKVVYGTLSHTLAL